MRKTIPILACLAVLLAAAYAPLRTCGFVEHDDNIYVYDNPRVSDGLSWDGLRWAFTTFHAGNWHPLTWVSHQADATVFGLRPFGHHVTSLALHAANTTLLFLLLRSLAGLTAASALMAAFFAVHPLHVESVAWVSERKDVLSAFFLLLTISNYVSWLRTTRSRRYFAALGAYALSLLSKPMGVTLPFLLLLLDYWPLGRFLPAPKAGVADASRLAALRRPLVEKVPFLFLAAASSVVTLVAQGRGEMFSPMPLAWRLTNALNACTQYLLKVFWPARLSAFYPHPEGALSPGVVLAAAAFLVVVSAAAVLAARRRPWLVVGWFWYLGALVPVIGVVQVGSQAYADRYTYLPLVGFFGAVAWEAIVPHRNRRWRAIAGAVAVAWLVALVPATRRQVGSWRDSMALFSQMLVATEGNWVGHNGVGIALGRAGRFGEAVTHFREAVRIRPAFHLGWSNLGNALSALKDPGAVAAFEEAIRLKPDYAEAYYNLALHYANTGDFREASVARRRLERVDPSWAARLDGYVLR